MNDITCHIGILYVDLFIPDSQSLKDKRHVIKSLKDRIRNNFNVSVAEVDGLDKWQIATVAFCMVNSGQKHIDRSLQSIPDFIESNYPMVQLSGRRMEFV